MGDPYPLGETIITWSAVDASGNVATSVIQTVTITDDEAPVISAVLPIEVSADANSCAAILTIPVPSVSDNVGATAATGVRGDGLALTDPYPLGETIITWSAVDAAANTAIPVTQTVTVNDTQAPVIESVSAISQSTDAGVSTATVLVVAPGVSDNCDNLLTATGLRGDGLALTDPYPLGETIITWTAVDAAGNAATSIIQTVTINLPPEPDFSMYINAGSVLDGMFENRLFVGDEQNPSQYSTGSGKYYNGQIHPSEMLKSNRNISSKSGLTYSLPVPDGIYTVTTYHIESYIGPKVSPSSYTRVFDVLVEGEVVRNNLNLYQEQGNNLLKIVMENVTVTDGILEVAIKPELGAAVISGIAVEGFIPDNFAPIASIDYSPNTGLSTDVAIQFGSSGSSDDEGIVGYTWDFGDGSTSIEANPIHTYSQAGSYTVSLTVADQEGAEGTSTVQVGVFEPIPNYDFSMYINAGSVTDGMFENRLFVGDEKNPSQYSTGSGKYFNSQIHPSEMLKSNRNISSKSGLTYSLPVPDGIYTVTTYHIESYIGPKVSPSSYTRVFDVLVEGEVVRNNLNLYQEQGNNLLKIVMENVTVTDGILEVAIKPELGAAVISGIAVEGFIPDNFAPIASIDYSPNTGLSTDVAIQFGSSGSSDDEGIVGYTWDFGDGSTSIEANPIHTYSQAGSYTVSLTVADQEGAEGTSTVQVGVFEPIPNYDFSMYINAGSVTDGMFENRLFVGDEKNPSQYSTGSGKYFNSQVHPSEMLKSNRNKGSGSLLTYSIPVPDGVYKVTTYHIESYIGLILSPGSYTRIFDVLVEGETVRNNLNLYQEQGNNLLKIVTENVIVTDGVLEVAIKPELGAAVISGIAIEGFISLPAAKILIKPTILASPMEGVGPLKVDFIGDLTEVDQGKLSYGYDFGDGTTSTDKNPSHVFISPGTYEVKVTVRDGKDIITMENLTIQVNKSNEVGFNSDSGFGDSSIKMYPNPARTIVNLQPMDPRIQIGEIAIFDINGRLVQKYEPSLIQDGNKYTIQVDSLAAGVYLLTTTTETGVTEMHRLIVK